MTKRCAAIMVCLCALTLAACVKLERQAVEKRFYTLEAVRPAPAVPAPALSAAAPGALLVRRLQISPRNSGRELVYRTGESAWSADYYHLFFVPPADMLTQDLRAWLSGSQLFSNVVDPGSLLEPAYVLEGNVSALHGDLSVRPGQAVADMQFLLLAETKGERRVLMSRQCRRSVALAANTPEAMVRALREAVSGIYADLELGLREALARQ